MSEYKKGGRFQDCEQCVCSKCTHNGVVCDACGIGCTGKITEHCAMQLIGARLESYESR